MNKNILLIILYSITIVVISWLLYLSVKKPNRISTNLPLPHASFETHHWGYMYRPYWRKYGGIPGFNPAEEDKPLHKPTIPVPTKPLIINTNPVLY